MSYFRVIPPVPITDAVLLSSSVAEPAAGEPALWAAGTYAAGAQVTRVTTHKIYERRIAGSSTTAPEVDPIGWTEIGYTNRWRMLSLDRTNATVADGPLTVSFNLAARADSWFVGGVNADTVRVQLEFGGITYYDHTSVMSRRFTTSWFEYAFGGFSPKSNELRFDMPLIANSNLTLTFERAAGPVSVASVVFGRSFMIGRTEYEADSDAINFSDIDRDEIDATATLRSRRSVPTTSQIVWTPKNRVTQVKELRERLSGKVAVWSGLGDMSNDGYFEMLLILGIAREFRINAKYPDEAKVTLDLEEM